MLALLSNLPPGVYGIIAAILGLIGFHFYSKRQGAKDKQLEIDEVAIKKEQQIRVIKEQERVAVVKAEKEIDDKFDELQAKKPIPKEDVAAIIFNRPKD